MPRRAGQPATRAADALASRLALSLGTALGDERRRRGIGTRQLAAKARLSPASINALEAGRRLSLDAYARVAVALGVPLDLVVDRRRTRAATDLVHAALGEYEARRLRATGVHVAIDHPYQHYQFAGRADVLAWSEQPAAMLHIENRTRFPDLQQAAGSYNAKRQYLARVVAEQLGIGPFSSQTHVMVCLWSAEVMRSLRERQASFRALCPDGITSWEAWLSGRPPIEGVSSSLVLLDPFAKGRRAAWVGLDDALRGTRPRIRGYPEAARRLSRDRA